MRQNPWKWAIALALLAGVFVYGALTTLRLRMDFGDAFAPYSTYRPDTMGTMAIFEGLRRLPGLAVSRNELPPRHLHGGAETLLLFLGVSETPDPPVDIDKLEAMVAAGAKLVLTYGMHGEGSGYTLTEEEAQYYRDDSETAEQRIRRAMAREEVPAVTPPISSDWGDGMTLASERWGFRVVSAVDDVQSDNNILPMPKRKKVKDIPVEAARSTQYPGALIWKSKEYLLPLNDRWAPLYTLPDGHVALMQRAYGDGSIVVASDSYFVSNEAQRKGPQGEILAFLVGDKSQVIFDEFNKGIDRSPGVVGLMKRYRLHVVMGVVVLLALLYAWRASISLVPRRTQEEEQERALLLEGRDANDGLAALLRRAIAPNRLLAACVHEWAQSYSRSDPAAHRKLEEAQRLLGGFPQGVMRQNEDEFASNYRALAAVLHDRRRKS